MIDLDKLERLAKAATPAPWDAVVSTGCVRYLGPPIDGTEHGDYVANCRGGPREIADSEYIAAANPSAILELIVRVQNYKLDLCQMTGNYEWMTAQRDAALARVRELAPTAVHSSREEE